MRKTKTARLRISELRMEHDRMTQAELAKQIGLSKTTISNLESGRLKSIALTTIAKLCRTLTCTPNDLFQLSGQTESKLAQRQRQALQRFLGSMVKRRST